MKIPGGYFDLGSNEEELKKLQEEQNEPAFWKDQARATKVQKRTSELESELKLWNDFKTELDDLKDIVTTAIKEKDESLENELHVQYERLENRWQKLEVILLFEGPYDQSDVIMSLHAGTGGVDAQDWTEMLFRMYQRFCEKNSWKIKIINKTTGQEAGIKSIEWQVSGPYAYGHLKAEAGVHRLVRISPFDAEKMRHTSFALVEALPVLPENDVMIDEKDIKIDTFRASGHGGQSVNTADSAVRITHLPTNIVVTCQNERSQLQNKQTALKILKGRLFQIQELLRKKHIKEIKGDFKKAQWGNQTRSYVLHPYKLVKDHRTNVSIQDVEKVLNGDLDELIFAWLKQEKKSH